MARFENSMMLREWRRTFVTAAIIAVGLTMILFLSRNIDRFSANVNFVIAGVVAIAMVAMALRWGSFPRAIVLIVLTALAVNFFTLPTGRESRVVVSLLISFIVLLVWILQLLLSGRTKERLHPSPINTPILLFVACNVLAYIWSNLIRDPMLQVWSSFPVVQLAALAVNITLPMMALLVINKLDDVRWLKIVTGITVAVGVMYLIDKQINSPIDIIFNNGTRGLFAMWFGGVLFTQAIFNKNLSITRRGFLIFLLVWLIYQQFIVSRSWVSGWLPLFVLMGAITWLRSKKAFLAGALVVVLMLALRFEQVVEAYNKELNEGSNQRVGLWLTNLRHVANHPVFGMGPAGYAVYNMTYNPRDARSTHNNYFDVLAQTGIVGFACFIWFLVRSFRVLKRNALAIKHGNDFEHGFVMLAFGGISGVILAMMLGDWVLPFAYNQTITGFDNAVLTWVFLGAGVLIAERIDERLVDKNPSEKRKAF
jgi:O-antigen ligase